jgi:hypothetical protein
VGLSCVLGVVAQPLRRAETLALYSGSCVVPLRLGGRRGKQSTPRVGWEVPVSIRRSASRTRHGAREAASSAGLRSRRGHQSRPAQRQRYGHLSGRIEGTKLL